MSRNHTTDVVPVVPVQRNKTHIDTSCDISVQAMCYTRTHTRMLIVNTQRTQKAGLFCNNQRKPYWGSEHLVVKTQNLVPVDYA